jgi:hypothetical protein
VLGDTLALLCFLSRFLLHFPVSFPVFLISFALLNFFWAGKGMLLLFALLSLSFATQLKPKGNLPSCGGCFAIVNGIYYACCNDMSINNNFCTCNENQPCTQCSPSPKDKEKVLLVAPSSKKPSALPSCNGCFSNVNGVNYACCDNMSIDNGDCTCDGNEPCTQCSPSSKDKEKVLLNKTNGVGPCGGLVGPMAQSSGCLQWWNGGICVPGQSDYAVQAQWYWTTSGQSLPAVITRQDNPNIYYQYVKASWDGDFSWRTMQVMFCIDSSCSSGYNLPGQEVNTCLTSDTFNLTVPGSSPYLSQLINGWYLSNFG